MKDIEIYSGFIEKALADQIYENLLTNINWQNELTVKDSTDKRKIHRKMSYVADTPVMYNYTNLIVQGEIWNKDLILLRDLLINKINVPFNSVLLNMYEDGKDEIRWHSDKEDQLGENPVIACINLGATRKFWFLNKETGEKTPYSVSNGDLLVMGENCQTNYLHAILKEKEVKEPRISLTYRVVYDKNS